MGKKKTQESTTKDKIISAASKLFLTDGYEKTSVRKVMNKAGLDFDTFNDFFSSKQELYNVVVEKFFGDFAADFERVMRKAFDNFAKMGLKPVIYRASDNVFTGRSVNKNANLFRRGSSKRTALKGSRIPLIP